MAQENDFAIGITLSSLSSQDGADLTFEHKDEVISCLDRCADAELAENLAAVTVLIRLRGNQYD